MEIVGHHHGSEAARIQGPASPALEIGLDVALKALRDCRRKKLATIDELYSVAQTRRMGRVMRPYLEALA